MQVIVQTTAAEISLKNSSGTGTTSPALYFNENFLKD